MKDVERWLKNGLIDENLAQILNADLKKKRKKTKIENADCIIHNRRNPARHRCYNICSRK